jgi:hypothetical protein
VNLSASFRRRAERGRLSNSNGRKRVEDGGANRLSSGPVGEWLLKHAVVYPNGPLVTEDLRRR